MDGYGNPEWRKIESYARRLDFLDNQYLTLREEKPDWDAVDQMMRDTVGQLKDDEGICVVWRRGDGKVVTYAYDGNTFGLWFINRDLVMTNRAERRKHRCEQIGVGDNGQTWHYPEFYGVRRQDLLDAELPGVEESDLLLGGGIGLFISYLVHPPTALLDAMTYWRNPEAHEKAREAETSAQ